MTVAILIMGLGSLSAQDPLAGADEDLLGEEGVEESERGYSPIRLKKGAEIEYKDDRLVPVGLDEIKFDVDLSKLPEAECAGIEDRRAILGFERPKAMWRIEDGFLGAYDGGEFGGALFYFSKDGSQRSLIVGEHVNDVMTMGDGDFVVAGGQELLGLGTGSVIEIMRMRDGTWKPNVLSRFFDGVPAIVGRTAEGTIVVSTWRTIASCHLSPPDESQEETMKMIGAYFEIRRDTWMRYLGESVFSLGGVYRPRGKDDGGQQGGAEQPATRPESDSEDGDKPKLESEGRSR